MMIGLLLLAIREYSYPCHSKQVARSWEFFCLLVSFLGLGIRIHTIGHAPQGTSGRNTQSQVAHTLNTTGMYSIVRHPLYLGNFFMGLGIALFVHLWWFALIYTLAFWLYYERIMLTEEAYIRGQFGDAFVSWANVTPAFVPDVRKYLKPGLPFSLKNVLRREYNGFLAVILLLFLLDTAGGWIVDKTVKADQMWVILLGAAFIIWMTLRALKKWTTLLNVNGR